MIWLIGYELEEEGNPQRKHACAICSFTWLFKPTQWRLWGKSPRDDVELIQRVFAIKPPVCLRVFSIEAPSILPRSFIFFLNLYFIFFQFFKVDKKIIKKTANHPLLPGNLKNESDIILFLFFWKRWRKIPN